MIEIQPLFAGTVQTHQGGYDPAPLGGREAHQALQAFLAEAKLIEQSGFDGILVAERHARSECLAPDPVGLLTAIATHTDRVFLGTFVRLLSLHHPIDLAEAWAQLDCLSAGRVVAGVGIGYNDRYFDLFGIPRTERRTRFDKALEILRAAWSGQCLETEWEGRPITGEVHPRPYGHIPIWMGSQFPKAISQAGAVADGWAVAFPFDRRRWNQMRAIYMSSVSESGRLGLCSLSRHCWIAKSREDAISRYAPLWLEELSYYWHRGQVTHADFTSATDLTVENAARNLILGTPEQCAEQIVDLTRGWGVDVLKIACRTPLGPSPEAVAENFARIGQEVLPLVRAALGLKAEGVANPSQMIRDAVAAAPAAMATVKPPT